MSLPIELYLNSLLGLLEGAETERERERRFEQLGIRSTPQFSPDLSRKGLFCGYFVCMYLEKKVPPISAIELSYLVFDSFSPTGLYIELST